MEEDIKVLEDYVYAMCTISCTTEQDKRIAQAIENLIKGYKDLDKENTRQHELLCNIHGKYKEDYIPKLKVREIIEDIDNNQPVIAELKLRKLAEGDK